MGNTPDPESGDESDSGTAMAAAMGFASFGTQNRAAKKRKFNAATDAFVEGQELAALDKGGARGQGSGGNTVPLGRTRIIGAPLPSEHDDKNPVAESKPSEDGPVDDTDGPRYMDTSMPAPLELEAEKKQQQEENQVLPASDEAREIQARIDALLSGLEATDTTDQTDTIPATPTTGAPPAGLPPRPQGAIHSPRNDPSNNNSPRHGQRNELWYVGYYDHSFNENPWARIESARDLPSVGGSWLVGKNAA